MRTVLSGVVVLLSVAGSLVRAQGQVPTLAAPTIFRMAGTLQTATGEPRTGVVVLVASLYSAQNDVTSLWSEAQTVTLDENGRYSILVGASVDGGVPKEFFLDGTGRWLGVGIQGEAEQPRVMLITVPYALKAVEADSLSGKTASDFVLAENLGSSVKTALGSEKSGAGPLVATTANALAKFTDSVGTVGDSQISEVGGVLTSNGFGQHALNGGGNGVQGLLFANSVNGTQAQARIAMVNSSGDYFMFANHSASFAETGPFYQRSGLIYGDGPKGLSIAAANATGTIRFYTGGTLERMSLSSAGVLAVSGFGTHTFDATGTGTNNLSLRNTAAGSINKADMWIGNDTSPTNLYMQSFSSLYSTSAPAFPNGALIAAENAGGLSIQAASSSGALRFYSGGSVERMRLDAVGNVGIGTSAPTAKLDVAGNINVSGNINAKYQDVAEWVETTAYLEPGTVVTVDPTAPNRVVAASRAYDTRVAGAVSKQPGLILGDGGPDKAMVAQSGRVRVKVDARYGAIHVGDLLVTSPTPGYAMRSRPSMVNGVPVHRAGTLLGKALEALPNGKGEILVLLTLQ